LAGLVWEFVMSSDTADAVVIGAGLNGAATAYFLLRNGLRRVVLLESELPGHGASGAAVGLLRTHYDNLPETELAAKSMPYFRNWDEMIGGNCGWRNTGFYRFVEPDQTDNMLTNIDFQRSFGEFVDVLTPEMLREWAPEFNGDGVGAVIHEPDAGTASNSLATISLLRAACANGGELRVYCRALSIIAEDSRVKGVSTERGEISTPVVVLAAGAACRDLAGSAGVTLPVEARAICVAEIAPPENLRIPGSYMDPITNSWLSPRRPGSGIISAPHPDAGKPVQEQDYERTFPRQDAVAGLPPVQKRLPGIAGARPIRWWRRADCYAPDGKPVIGGVAGLDGLFLNTAGAGKGHKVAPAIGKALGELILDGGSATADLSPFGIERLARAPARWSDSEYRQRVIG
jgi:sarcosine oxidase, subunit beta